MVTRNLRKHSEGVWFVRPSAPPLTLLACILHSVMKKSEMPLEAQVSLVRPGCTFLSRKRIRSRKRPRSSSDKAAMILQEQTPIKGSEDLTFRQKGFLSFQQWNRTTKICGVESCFVPRTRLDMESQRTFHTKTKQTQPCPANGNPTEKFLQNIQLVSVLWSRDVGLICCPQTRILEGSMSALLLTQWTHTHTHRTYTHAHRPVVVPDDEQHVFPRGAQVLALRVHLGRVVWDLEHESLPVVDLLEQLQQRPEQQSNAFLNHGSRRAGVCSPVDPRMGTEEGCAQRTSG